VCHFSFVAVIIATALTGVVTGGDVELVWAAHCRDDAGQLTQYADAMHRLATGIWPQNNDETRIEWGYRACVDYFFGGGLKHVRDKVARCHSHQHCTATAKDNVIRDNIDCSLNCVEPLNAVGEVESAISFSAESTNAV